MIFHVNNVTIIYMMSKTTQESHIFHKCSFVQGKDLADTIQKSLPIDIQHHIYRSHLWFEAEKKPVCDALLHWWKFDEDVKRLRVETCVMHEKIEILEELMKYATCIDYLCNEDGDFKKCYRKHFIEHKKEFALMSIMESFVVSIMMYKHH